MQPPASIQSEDDMQRIAREARIPVMTGQGEDIDGMADEVMDQDEMVRLILLKGRSKWLALKVDWIMYCDQNAVAKASTVWPTSSWTRTRWCACCLCRIPLKLVRRLMSSARGVPASRWAGCVMCHNGDSHCASPSQHADAQFMLQEDLLDDLELEAGSTPQY